MPEPVNWEANLRMLLKQIGRPGNCKACGAPITWVTTKNGRHAPINQFGVNHFADCAMSDRFRKSKEPIA